jgi:hypothetical protein
MLTAVFCSNPTFSFTFPLAFIITFRYPHFAKKKKKKKKNEFVRLSWEYITGTRVLPLYNRVLSTVDTMGAELVMSGGYWNLWPITWNVGRPCRLLLRRFTSWNAVQLGNNNVYVQYVLLNDVRTCKTTSWLASLTNEKTMPCEWRDSNV